MAENYQSNFLNALAGGFDFGQQLRKQRDTQELKGLAALAYGLPQEQRPSVLSQMAQRDPGFAQAQAKQWNADDDRDQKQLIGMARFIKSAPPEQQQSAYQKAILPALRARGMDAPDWTPETKDMILKTVDALTQWDADPGDTPSGYREFELLTNAAGYGPGSDDYKKAAGVRLGTVGRPSNAGWGFFEIDGPDGRKRMGRNNPRTGAREVYDEGTGDWVQVGSAGEASSGYGAGAGGNAVRFNVEGISPERQQQLANVVSTMRAANFSDDQIGAWLESALNPGGPAQATGAETTGWQPTVHPEIADSALPPRPSTTSVRSPVLGPGRTKEEEAAAVRTAEIETDLNYADRRADAEARAAAQKKAAEERAKLEADIAATNSTRTRDAETVLDLLARAERLVPSSTGSGLGARRDEWAAQFGESTQGGEAIAALRVLSGQLVGKMPRMEGPQSDADRLLYQQMAGDLANPYIPVPQRMAALREIKRLNEKYAGQPGTTSGTQRSSTPRVGEVRNGYRFRGGNPGDKNNWEPI